MKKKLLAAIAAAAMLCTVFFGMGMPVSALRSGGFRYRIENGGVVIYTYMGSEKNVEIPEKIKGITVTAIKSMAFMNDEIESIHIPSGVTEAELFAFYFCANLKNIIVAAANTQFSDVGGVLFNKDKTTLIFYPMGKTAASYTIPTGVTSIGFMAFIHNENLASITVPDSVSTINAAAFSGTAWYDNQPSGPFYAGKVFYKYIGAMPKNKPFTLAAGTLGIASLAFDWQEGLVGVNLPDSLLTIGERAFMGCKGLQTVNIPASVNAIGYLAFTGCHNLTSITVNVANNYYTSNNGVLFNKAKTVLFEYPPGKPLGAYSVPAGVTHIGDYAFLGCEKLETVAIPKSVTHIGEDAFDNNTTIRCYEASAAHTFALDNEIPFTLITGPIYPLGQISGGAVLRIDDVRLVLQHLVDKIQLSPELQDVADVDGIGGVTITDARLILQKLVEKIETFPRVT